MASDKTQKLTFLDEVCRAGVDRAEWHGGPFTVVRYRYAPGSVFPTHRHDSAQITVILSGRIRFKIEKADFVVDVGETVYIPPGATHSATVPADSEPVLSINIFHPPRKEHP